MMINGSPFFLSWNEEKYRIDSESNSTMNISWLPMPTKTEKHSGVTGFTSLAQLKSFYLINGNVDK